MRQAGRGTLLAESPCSALPLVFPRMLLPELAPLPWLRQAPEEGRAPHLPVGRQAVPGRGLRARWEDTLPRGLCPGRPRVSRERSPSPQHPLCGPDNPPSSCKLCSLPLAQAWCMGNKRAPCNRICPLSVLCGVPPGARLTAPLRGTVMVGRPTAMPFSTLGFEAWGLSCLALPSRASRVPGGDEP